MNFYKLDDWKFNPIFQPTQLTFHSDSSLQRNHAGMAIVYPDYLAPNRFLGTVASAGKTDRGVKASQASYRQL